MKSKLIILIITMMVYFVPNHLNAQFSGDGNNTGGNLGPTVSKKEAPNTKSDTTSFPTTSNSRQDISLDKEPVNTGVTTTTVGTGRYVGDKNETAENTNNAGVGDNNDDTDDANGCNCGGKWGLLGLLGLMVLAGLYKKNNTHTTYNDTTNRTV